MYIDYSIVMVVKGMTYMLGIAKIRCDICEL